MNRVIIHGDKISIKDGDNLIQLNEEEYTAIYQHCIKMGQLTAIRNLLTDEADQEEVELTEEEIEDAIDDIYEYLYDFDKNPESYDYSDKIGEILEDREYVN